MTLILLALLAAIGPLSTAAFDELDRMCARDNGAIWGRSLCGPILFVEPATREYVSRNANGEIERGTLSASTAIANTAIEWKGGRWTMIMWPLPENTIARRSLLAHESFHRIAPQIGITSSERPNAHLDSVEGRWLMQLEWRALARALAGEREAIRDALAFRARRYELFPAAAAEEHALEMNEGLAEYTGVALAVPVIAERIPYLVTKLREAESTPTFVRSFAYATTPAWGTLLEQHDRRWTRKLDPSQTVPNLVKRATRSKSIDAGTAAARYDGETLLAKERARDEQRKAQLAAFASRFVDGPRLILPLRQMSMEFDPNKAAPFPPHGTVYPTITIRDEWGSIIVRNGGALIASDWSMIVVPASENDYALTLNDGWTRAPATRAGDFTLKKTP